jgi:CubicO group peptidase (beta-lactamase class C family)
VPGVIIAIIKDFKIAATFVYGVADVETGAKVTSETMFQAASISKPVTAMASLKAVQEGKFRQEIVLAFLLPWMILSSVLAILVYRQ